MKPTGTRFIPGALQRAWQTQARRIDAMSLRERAFLFLSAAVVLVAATDALVLSPGLAEQRTLSARTQQQAGELDKMRAQLLAGREGPSAQSPVGKLMAELRAVQAERAAVDADIEQHLSQRGTGSRLPQLLERVLGRHERLTLLRLAATAPVAPLAPPAPLAAASSTAAAPQAPRQSVDLSLRGSYADLTRYVADTEDALSGLRWTDIKLERKGSATELHARVELLGSEP